jgi:hypothetical protein
MVILSDSMNPSSNENLRSDGVPPPLSPEAIRKSGSARQVFTFLLSLCLALFLVDAVISLADDSLILVGGFHPLSALRGLVGFFAMLMSVGIYGLMGLTPLVPKRLFLPIPLFFLAAVLATFLFMIYCFGQLRQIGWGMSVVQVIIGLGILRWSQGGFGFRWPLVPIDRLGVRAFSWRNLSVFVLVNVFALLPAVIIYLFFCTALAVGHFSEGFMALRPGGFSVQVRKYVRDDGKTIELFPMSHVADAGFYQKVSQTFPTNSIILMEGVTDENNLLTNKITYQRMAKSLGLAEQHEKFEPTRGKMVRADVDVDQFSQDTIGFLNLVMLIHSRGLTPANVQKLMEYSPPAHFEEKLMDDLVKKRNQRVVEEIQSRLSQTDNVMVPWGVAHMPGIADEIQKSGFRLDSTREYMVIQFRKQGSQADEIKP